MSCLSFSEEGIYEVPRRRSKNRASQDRVHFEMSVSTSIVHSLPVNIDADGALLEVPKGFMEVGYVCLSCNLVDFYSN